MEPTQAIQSHIIPTSNCENPSKCSLRAQTKLHSASQYLLVWSRAGSHLPSTRSRASNANPPTLVDVEGEQRFKFQKLSVDSPLNHNKQKCKMYPNNNHATQGVRLKSEPPNSPGPGWTPWLRRPGTWTSGPVEGSWIRLGGTRKRNNPHSDSKARPHYVFLQNTYVHAHILMCIIYIYIYTYIYIYIYILCSCSLSLSLALFWGEKGSQAHCLASQPTGPSRSVKGSPRRISTAFCASKLEASKLRRLCPAAGVRRLCPGFPEGLWEMEPTSVIQQGPNPKD